MALGWSPRLGANYRRYAVLGVSMPPPHLQARVAAADDACALPALLQRCYSEPGRPCRNSLQPAATRILQKGLRRTWLLAARAAPDSSGGPVASPRRGRRKATQPDVPPGSGAADARGPSSNNTPAMTKHAQREGKAASRRPLESSGGRDNSSNAEEARREGAVLLGTLTYRKPYLKGPRVLRSAFPQQVAAAVVSGVEGGPTKQAVQLHARLPDGQPRPYDVSLCRVGQSSTFYISRTRLLAADLGLSEGDELPLYQLPDGRAVVGGTAAGVGVQQILSVSIPLGSSAYLMGVDAIRQAFPAQTEAVLCGRDPPPVRVYGRFPGGELHPYDLKLRPLKFKNRTSVSFRLEGISWLLGDLGLQHGDTVRLCVQPDGVVVLEPTHPRPVDPNAITLTKTDVQEGEVAVPLRIATRLLGEEACRVTGPSVDLPVRLEGGRGLTGKLRGCDDGTSPKWSALTLRRWFVACGASSGDTLRLEKEDDVSAPAAEGADPSGPHGPAEGPQVARVGSLVARLVRSREREEAREGAGGP